MYKTAIANVVIVTVTVVVTHIVANDDKTHTNDDNDHDDHDDEDT